LIEEIAGAGRIKAAVDDALRTLLGKELSISLEAVERIVSNPVEIPWPVQLVVRAVDLAAYDALLRNKEVSACYQTT